MAATIDSTIKGASANSYVTLAEANTYFETVQSANKVTFQLNVTTNTNAITSINGVIGDGTGFVTDSELATVSAALASSIGNSNSAITSINTVLAATSSALATSIGNSNTNILSLIHI